MEKIVPRWMKYLYVFTSVIFLIVIFAEHNNMFFELIVSTAVYLLCGGILMGIGLVAATRSKIAMTGLLIFLFTASAVYCNTVGMKSLLGKNFKTVKEVSILQLNVYLFNRQKRKTIDFILKKNPHIVTLHEIGRNWDGVLNVWMRKKFPYRVSVPGSYFGVSLYSRYPVEKYSTVTIDKTVVLISEILIDKKVVTVITYHSYAPLNEGQLIFRNNQISRLISIINGVSGPKIVTGDFNAVPWSWIMKKFKRETDLSDSRKSLLNTYPSKGFLKVPIDYIMFSDHFVATRKSSLLATSSDHLGIITTCGLVENEM